VKRVAVVHGRNSCGEFHGCKDAAATERWIIAAASRNEAAAAWPTTSRARAAGAVA
jgi:hypothetical protein